MIELPILKENKELGINKADETYRELAKKLIEEVTEVAEASINLNEHNASELFGEYADIVQLALGGMVKMHKEGRIDFGVGFENHNNKLNSRNWIKEGCIEMVVRLFE